MFSTEGMHNAPWPIPSGALFDKNTKREQRSKNIKKRAEPRRIAICSDRRVDVSVPAWISFHVWRCAVLLWWLNGGIFQKNVHYLTVNLATYAVFLEEGTLCAIAATKTTTKMTTKLTEHQTDSFFPSSVIRKHIFNAYKHLCWKRDIGRWCAFLAHWNKCLPTIHGIEHLQCKQYYGKKCTLFSYSLANAFWVTGDKSSRRKPAVTVALAVTRAIG